MPCRAAPSGRSTVNLEGHPPSAAASVTFPNLIVFHASNTLREINLAGDVLRQITDQELSAALTAQGYTIDTPEVHHDVIELANGHWILLVHEVLTYQDLPGYPGVTKVSGDVLVDLDPSNKPVWVWRAFDHLDINRHPIFFPDWTHGNAVVLTPDGNLLLSLRHQHWVLKIDYANGTGTGDVLWRLGPDGDFTLDGGDPAAWFYAQQRCGRVGAHRRRRLGLRHGLVRNVGRKRRHLAERRRGI